MEKTLLLTRHDINAITANIKTQYRYIADPQPVRCFGCQSCEFRRDHFIEFSDPPVNKGDVIWIKEAYRMKKEQCKLSLLVTDVKIHQLQDITKEDAIAEGMRYTDFGSDNKYEWNWHWEEKVSGYEYCLKTPRDAFGNLWVTRFGQESWDSNPWVWKIVFNIIKN
jgi:hypothetical protein